MRKMSRRRFLRWEKLRLKGKRYYILRTAVLATIVIFLVLNFASWSWRGISMPDSFALVYPALGLIVAAILWTLNEERFEAFLVNKKARAGKRR
jgi:hypothetical protein